VLSGEAHPSGRRRVGLIHATARRRHGDRGHSPRLRDAGPRAGGPGASALTPARCAGQRGEPDIADAVPRCPTKSVECPRWVGLAGSAAIRLLPGPARSIGRASWRRPCAIHSELRCVSAGGPTASDARNPLLGSWVTSSATRALHRRHPGRVVEAEAWQVPYGLTATRPPSTSWTNTGRPERAHCVCRCRRRRLRIRREARSHPRDTSGTT
jgi:hypothetical protein